MTTIGFWLFPFSGLFITDASNSTSFGTPLFDDLSWVSIEQFHELLNKDAEEMAWLNEVSPADGYLALRSRIPSEQAEYREAAEKAERRISEMSAMITIATVGLDARLHACGLSRMFSNSRPTDSRFSIYDPDAGQFATQVISVPPRFFFETPTDPWQMTAKDLNALVTAKALGILGQCVMQSRSPLNPNMTQRVRTACVHIANAITARTTDAQCLRSANAIEVLFGRVWQTSRERARKLLGASTFEQYRGNEVFKARHDYVHSNVPVEFDVAVKSIFLSIDCVRRYSNVALFARTTAFSDTAIDTIVAHGVNNWFEPYKARVIYPGVE